MFLWSRARPVREADIAIVMGVFFAAIGYALGSIAAFLA
jgi:hypothetical protein